MRPYLVLLVLLSMATPVCAQEQDTLDALLQPGARVRITIPNLSRWTGRLHSVTTQSLTLLNEEGMPGETIDWSETEQVEVSRGRRRAGWTVGGIVLGALVGVIYTRATLEEDPADIGGVLAAAEGVSNVLAGMVVGGLAGRVLAPERWTAVPPPTPAP